MYYQPQNHYRKSAIARSFSHAASTYDQVSIVQREVGFRLLERLEWVRLKPSLILDLGGGTGFFSQVLLQKYPRAQVIHCDIAEGMLSFSQQHYHAALRKPFYLCGDGDYLPLQSQTIDFIFSNCALQWFLDPNIVFQEIRRVLKPNGLLLFSTFGVDTLKELRYSFAKIDNNDHVNTFMDMHTIGDILLHQNFQDPVMDMEILTLTYKHLKGLLRDLKQMGAHTVDTTKPKGLYPKDTFDKLSQHYEDYRSEEGLLPATFEVVYGHAWNPEQPPVSLCQRSVIPITQIESTF